jgi:hypothetical protein
LRQTFRALDKDSMNRLLPALMAALSMPCVLPSDASDKIGIYVSPEDEHDPDYNVSYTSALDTLKGHARTVWVLERWRKIETKEGEYDWSSVDRRVGEAVKRGFDIGLRLQIVLVGNDEKKRPVAVTGMPLYLGEKMDSDAFNAAVVRFYAAAAQRYKGKARYIAVGNSVNSYFERHPDNWEAFKKIYPKIVDAIHAVDPKLIVMSDVEAGTEFFNDEKKISRYTDFFRDSNDDAAGFLFYYIDGVYYGKDFANFGPKNMNEAVEKLHRWAGKKPIYFIETACFSRNSKTGDDISGVQTWFMDMLLKTTTEKDWILGVSWWLMYDAKDLPHVPWDVKATFGLFSADGKAKPAWETWKRYADKPDEKK